MKCASGWGKVNFFFENVLLAGEFQKGKMLKMGGTHVCAQGIDTQT